MEKPKRGRPKGIKNGEGKRREPKPPKPKQKKRINSRAKGARGEREFAAYLQAHGLEARRGQQFAGGTDSPDVVCKPLEHVHFEVKRVEAGTSVIYKWMGQAGGDAGPNKLPVVAHRNNKNGWVAILPMTDLLRLLILREKHIAEMDKPIRFPGPRIHKTKPAAKILKAADIPKFQALLQGTDPDADILG